MSFSALCILCISLVTGDQEQRKAGIAAELLLQRNLEITEMKCSEARTIAATRAHDLSHADSVISLDAEDSPAVLAIGDEAAQAKEGDGCTLQ